MIHSKSQVNDRHHLMILENPEEDKSEHKQGQVTKRSEKTVPNQLKSKTKDKRGSKALIMNIASQMNPLSIPRSKRAPIEHMSARYQQQLVLDFETSPSKNVQMPGRTSLIQKSGHPSITFSEE